MRRDTRRGRATTYASAVGLAELEELLRWKDGQLIYPLAPRGRPDISLEELQARLALPYLTWTSGDIPDWAPDLVRGIIIQWVEPPGHYRWSWTHDLRTVYESTVRRCGLPEAVAIYKG